MRISSLSLPHPVLEIEDDVSGSYEVNCNVTLSPEIIKLSLNHKLSNKTLENMLAKRQAIYIAEIQCPQTIFRKSYSLKESTTEIKISSTLLRNRVDLRFFIVATKSNDKYRIRGSNPDYAGYSFEIGKGDVLAWGGSTSFMALKDWRALKAADSFLKIDEYPSTEGPMKIRLGQNKIIVELSKNDFKKYKLLHRKSRKLFAIFHSSIVFPVLLYALTKAKERGEEYKDQGWYQVLEFRKNNEKELQRFDWDSVEDLPKIAQELLGHPISRMLLSVDDLLISNEEGGD